MSLRFFVLALSSCYFTQGLFAQEGESSSVSTYQPIIALILMFAVFYFMIILPNSRKAKKQAEFLSQLRIGDDVITQSGFYGKISNLEEKVVTLEIAPQVRIRIDRQTISTRQDSQSSSKISEKAS